LIKEQNARVDSVSLGSDDHGGITCWLHLEYTRGTSQGFGGYDLRWWGGYFIQRVLEVVGEEFWEKLPGKVVRVRTEDGGSGQKIVAIGNATEDEWFAPGSKADQKAAHDLMRKVLNKNEG
jgi:hypothetical protein